MITLHLERKCRTESLGSGKGEADSQYILGTAYPFRALNNSLEMDNGDGFIKQQKKLISPNLSPYIGKVYIHFILSQ